MKFQGFILFLILTACYNVKGKLSSASDTARTSEPGSMFDADTAESKTGSGDPSSQQDGSASSQATRCGLDPKTTCQKLKAELALTPNPELSKLLAQICRADDTLLSNYAEAKASAFGGVGEPSVKINESLSGPALVTLIESVKLPSSKLPNRLVDRFLRRDFFGQNLTDAGVDFSLSSDAFKNFPGKRWIRTEQFTYSFTSLGSDSPDTLTTDYTFYNFCESISLMTYGVRSEVMTAGFPSKNFQGYRSLQVIESEGPMTFVTGIHVFELKAAANAQGLRNSLIGMYKALQRKALAP